MVIFLLKPKAQTTLDGARVETIHRLVPDRETEKAVLLEVAHVVEGMDAKVVGYWLPKSQIKIEDDKIEIPNWLWEKKKEAMDFAR